MPPPLASSHQLQDSGRMLVPNTCSLVTSVAHSSSIPALLRETALHPSRFSWTSLQAGGLCARLQANCRQPLWVPQKGLGNSCRRRGRAKAVSHCSKVELPCSEAINLACRMLGQRKRCLELIEKKKEYRNLKK